MTKKMVLTLATVAGVAGLSVRTSLAQVINHVAWSNVEAGSWTFNPVYAAGENPTIVGFLALAEPGSVLGSNIVAVWYSRGETGWSAKSWETTDSWKAIASVKQMMGISDEEDDRWSIPVSNSTDAEPPTDYQSGVLTDDPLAELLASSPDRDIIIQILTDAGYKSADVPIEQNDGCSVAAKLDGMAAAIVETLGGEEGTMVDRAMSAFNSSLGSGCGFKSLAVTIIEFPPTAVTPWGPTGYLCTTSIFPPPWPDGFGYSCANESWTTTRTLTQRRTRSRFNPSPPPLYLYCDQSRAGTETNAVECSMCASLAVSPPIPCPTPPAPGFPAPGTCLPGWTRTSTTTTAWGAWAPPCPF